MECVVFTIRFLCLENFSGADVAELADVPDLESGAARLVGSSPTIRTNIHEIYVKNTNTRIKSTRESSHPILKCGL